jgi:hypothetical protein
LAALLPFLCFAPHRPINHQTAISQLLSGQFTPPFQHSLSSSICSGLIRDGNGGGSSLFAWFFAVLLPFLCFVPHHPINHQMAISWLLSGRLTPSFQHSLSPSIYSGLICNGNGGGSALIAWF